MELVDRVDGVGRIRYSAKEGEKIREICDIIEKSGKSWVLGELNQPTGTFERLMKELFPSYPLVKGMGYANSYNTNHDTPIQIVGIANNRIEESLQLYGISSRLLIAEAKMVLPVELYFLFPTNSKEERACWMTIVLDSDYEKGCVDDIVAKLGERESPPLQGPQPIVLVNDKDYRKEYHGFAEVPHLDKIIGLYIRAQSTVRWANDTLGISTEELKILRRDALQHENIALRKLSREHYEQALLQLVHR